MTHASIIHGARFSVAQEYLAGWQRARAELDNFRKRVQARQHEQVTHHVQRVLEPVLSLNDNFRAMIDHVPAELADHAWAQGVLHIARQLNDILTQFGVTVVGDVGDTFDPRLHEALEDVANTAQPSGTIVEVVQVGYQLNDKIIRPAKVKIAS